MLASDLLSSWQWPWSSVLPNSISCVLGLKMYTTMPGINTLFFSAFVLLFGAFEMSLTIFMTQAGSKHLGVNHSPAWASPLPGTMGLHPCYSSICSFSLLSFERFCSGFLFALFLMVHSTHYARLCMWCFQKTVSQVWQLLNSRGYSRPFTVWVFLRAQETQCAEHVISSWGQWL